MNNKTEVCNETQTPQASRTPEVQRQFDPITIIAAVSAAISLINQLTPIVQGWVEKGEISDEDQAKLAADYQSLRNKTAGQFSGPEWEQSGRTT